MAESFVYGIAENLLGKIASFVGDEVALASGLEADLTKLQDSLKTVNAVLLDAETQAQNHELRHWLGMLKNFCFDAEDVLDELDYQGLRRKVLKQYGNTKIKVRHFFSTSNPFLFRVKMGHKVKELRERLDQIADLKSKFHLAQHVDPRQAGRRSTETYSFLHMSNVIGRDYDKEKILAFLFHQTEGETLSVISIVGLGGIGKTTLAQMLYNDWSVGKHFDLKIWVWVSDDFEEEKIMVRMGKSLNLLNRGELDLENLQKMIREELNSKKFLLVLDDLWSCYRGKWIKFQELLMEGSAGSKIIVTTRNASVADTVGTGLSYHLERLSREQCLSLFKKLAFREGEEESHLFLMEISDDILEKCGGIPLAVKTVGALLYSNSDRRYWESIRDSETWKEDHVLPVLKLSYDQLPLHLKPCFAICSIYPKGYVFTSDELSRIWMANGLLQPSNEQEDMEDIGVQYIKELHSRSFMDHCQAFGDVMYFRMHGLVHDLARSVSQNECFVVKTRIQKVPDGIRFLGLLKKDSLDQVVLRFLQNENILRTIIFGSYEMTEFLSESSVNSLISASKCLRMLDLGGCALKALPRSIDGLKHLRSLDLSGSIIKRLPDSIWKLHNLLYLNLDGCCELEELPRDVRNLIKLRYLLITAKQKRFSEDGIGCLRSLQFLSIQRCSNLEFLFEGIERLTSLRALEVLGWDKLISLPRSLMYLNNLENLEIKNCNRFNWTDEDDIEGIKLSLRSLHTLKVSGCDKLISLPRNLMYLNALENLEIRNCNQFNWMDNDDIEDIKLSLRSLCTLEVSGCDKLISLPRNLIYLNALQNLEIKNCNQFNWMEEDDIKNIKLSLQSLKLVGLPLVVTIPPWLQKSSKTLRCLEVSDCGNFSSFPQWFQDFTSLKEIMIIRCPRLISLPEGMHRLTSLKELMIGGCPMLDERYIKREDLYEIAHVPHIRFHD